VFLACSCFVEVTAIFSTDSESEGTRGTSDCPVKLKEPLHGICFGARQKCAGSAQ
jgi:hypothetical protein